MSVLEFAATNSEPLESNLVEAGIYASAEQAHEHGLVVLALGQPYWLAESAGGFRLLVEHEGADAVQYHLSAYDRESAHWPPPPIVDPWRAGKADLFTPFLWAIVVLAIFHFSMRAPQWFDAGALDARALFADGEWWRAATALFLHADSAHVIANALGGVLAFSAVVSTFGRLRGWMLVLVSGVLGNVAVAAVNHPADYRAVGASTAIFAAVGLLTGRAVRIAWRSAHPHRWRAMFGPLAAGATVLALHGAGGQRVDVGAHLTGFLAGSILGFVAGLHARAGRPAASPAR